ncbi:MAG: phytanoyl-CoA dioxygenase family protein [Lentisphaeria bacterium]|nr:phytanoyl-CoA dioxygenase family protein [Lentisphaeria bacterium]NQZ70811.1 phytanoyl-CoA dioxygenase family protein [Lentisphaeria bacterium]
MAKKFNPLKNKMEKVIDTEKREQLLRDGYCILPNLLDKAFLDKLRAFTHDFLDTHEVPDKAKYQGSNFHVYREPKEQENKSPDMHYADMADELLDYAPQKKAAESIGLENITDAGAFIILSKEAKGPKLYWHQDNMQWNHPKSALPWPTKVFLSYYLVDTTRENGCLRVIPGSHLKRLPIHDHLPAAHGPELRSTDTNHPAFQDHPDEIDLPCKAGDLVIADDRLLHAAWENKSDIRRPLILQWWHVFPFPSVPSWWDGTLPDELKTDPNASYEGTRIPGEFLKA